MADVAKELHHEAVLHRIALERYSTGLVRRVLAQLSRVEESIVGRLAQGLGSGERLEAQLKEFQGIQREGWKLIGDRLDTELEKLSATEARFAHSAVRFAARGLGISVTSPLPPLNQIVAAVRARPFQGRLLREWLADTEASTAKKVRETIRQGYIEGQTIDQMVRTLRGTKAAQFRDGVLEINRRGAEAMVRTAVTHTSNVAGQQIYEAAGDSIVEGWEFVATLDSRTSVTCARLDGKVYAVGKGPIPPRHIRCRSISIARLRGMKPTPRKTYAQWLKEQSQPVQDDILGASKGALFRTGGLSVDRFTDASGKVLTLAQLEARNSAAFVRAGLDNPVKPPPGTPKDAVALFLADKTAQRSLLTNLMGSGSYGVDYHAQIVDAVKERNGWKAETNDLLAIRHYTGSAYKQINERMREYGGLLADRQFTALAARGVETLPDFVKETWRAPAKTRALGDAMWAKAVVGEDFDVGNQLLSTSANRGFAVDWGTTGRLILHITNPRGAYVDEISLNRGEGEVLLPPGLRYRVVRKSEQDLPGQGGAPRSMRVIVLEIIDP